MFNALSCQAKSHFTIIKKYNLSSTVLIAAVHGTNVAIDAIIWYVGQQSLYLNNFSIVQLTTSPNLPHLFFNQGMVYWEGTIQELFGPRKNWIKKSLAPFNTGHTQTNTLHTLGSASYSYFFSPQLIHQDIKENSEITWELTLKKVRGQIYTTASGERIHLKFLPHHESELTPFE